VGANPPRQRTPAGPSVGGMLRLKQKVLTGTALAAASAALAAPSAALAGGNEIKVRDACDPASFNAALGDGACVRDDGGRRVTFDALLAGVAEDGEHGAWSFSSPITVDEGESVAVRFDRGGEMHTFSEVRGTFGAGCVPELNELMGLEGPPVVDCSTAFTPAELVGPALSSNSVAGLDEGEHRFQCAIHPWMRTTVIVRED
jgi:hypothetical protein